MKEWCERGERRTEEVPGGGWLLSCFISNSARVFLCCLIHISSSFSCPITGPLSSSSPPSLLFHQPSPLLPFNDRYAHIKMSLNAGWKCAVASEPHRRPEPEQTSEKHLNVKQMFCKTHSSLHFVEPFLLLHPPLVSFFLSSVHTSVSLSLSLSGRGLISEIGQDIFWPISLTFRSVGLQRGSVPARKKHKTHKSKNLGERLGALGQREATSALPLYSIAGTSHFKDLPLTATAKLPTSNHITSP